MGNEISNDIPEEEGKDMHKIMIAADLEDRNIA